MSNFEFTRLADVEKIETMSEEASVLIENKGAVKRIPASSFAGNSGGETLPIVTLDECGDYVSNDPAFNLIDYAKRFQRFNYIVGDNPEGYYPFATEMNGYSLNNREDCGDYLYFIEALGSAGSSIKFTISYEEYREIEDAWTALASV